MLQYQDRNKIATQKSDL